MMKISVVLSFRNEEKVIPELIGRLQSSLKTANVEHELIFVNDDSTDGSKRLLEGYSDSDKRIKLINLSRNFGISPSVMAGLKYSSGDAVIYMDCDLQDPPELIPEMIRTFRDEEADVVNTKRLSRSGESKIKLFITRLGYFILNRASNIALEPEVGDFKLLSRRAVDILLNFRESRPYTRGLIRWIGLRQKTIGYHREARFAGRTKFLVLGWGVVSNFLDSALISFSDIPLKISLILGFIISFFAFLFLIGVLVLGLLHIPVSGWATLMATILILGGMQLLTIGVLGLYINSIFIQSKGRPLYIVESTVGFDKESKDNA